MQVIPKNLYNRGKVLIPCPSCGALNPLPILGWSVAACHNCSNQIIHPTSQVKTGFDARGNKSKGVSVRFPEHEENAIAKLAKEHGNCSRSAMIVYLCMIGRRCIEQD